MTDNVKVRQETATDAPVIAADNIGGVLHQRVKMQYGADGSATDVSLSDPMPVTSHTFEIATGNIAGHSIILKFGANTDVASGITEDIWDGGGTYPFPTTADITHIAQTVDQAAMRGATIELQGLDINFGLVVQTKALDASNTTTIVAINTPLLRIFRMKVLANVVGDQDIVARNVGGGITYALMVNGNNQTLMSIYTVPHNKTAYLLSYYADAILVTGKEPKSTDIRLWTADRLNNFEFQLKHAKGISPGSSNFQHLFNPPMRIEQCHDVKITALPNGAGADVRAGFDIILVDNT